MGPVHGGTYVPSLNLKPVVSHIEEEAMLLSLFYYCICTFLCCCCSFNPSFCHFLPFLLPCVVSRPWHLSEFKSNSKGLKKDLVEYCNYMNKITFTNQDLQYPFLNFCFVLSMNVWMSRKK